MKMIVLSMNYKTFSNAHIITIFTMAQIIILMYFLIITDKMIIQDEYKLHGFISNA